METAEKGYEKTKVSSSVIDAIEYSVSEEVLTVYFNNGTVYEYRSVGSDTADSLLNANSHGTYLNRYIKPYYDYTRIS